MAAPTLELQFYGCSGGRVHPFAHFTKVVVRDRLIHPQLAELVLRRVELALQARLLRFEASRDRRKLRHLTTRLRHFDTQIAKPALQPDLLSQHRELPPPQLERATNGADPVFRLVCELPHDC